MTPARPLTQAMHYALLRGSFYQIWWPRGIPKQFDLWLTLGDHSMTVDLRNAFTLWSAVLPTKFGSHRAFLSNLTFGWIQVTLLDLWLHQCAMLYSGLLPTKSCGHMAFLSNLTSGWPRLTHAWPLTPSNALHSDQGVLPTKFGGRRAFLRQIDLWMTFNLWWGGSKI